MSTWVKIIFIASLALNLAVVGAFAGHRMGLWKGKHHHGISKFILSSVPAEKRDAVETILANLKKEHPRRGGKYIENWQLIDSKLRQENFDRAEFLEAFQTEINRKNQRYLAGGNAIADIAELLTPQERVEALDKMKKKLKRRRKYKK